MPFDDEKFYAPATKGELGGAIVKITLSLGHVLAAFRSIQLKEDPAEHITKLSAALNELDVMFDALTGYKPK